MNFTTELVTLESVDGLPVAINPQHVRCVAHARAVGLDGEDVCGVIFGTKTDALAVRGTVQSVAERLSLRFRMEESELFTRVFGSASPTPLCVPIARDGYPFPRGAEPPQESTPPLSTPEAKACLSREHTRRPAREVIEHVLTALPPAQLALVMADTSGMPPDERPYACLVRACECNFLDWNVLAQ